MADDSGTRHSVAGTADLIQDEDEKAKREAHNGLLQFDFVKSSIDEFLTTERPFKLRLSIVLSLNRIALQGIDAYAGNFRPADIEIGKSRHEPPGAHLVPELVEDMCDYVNSNWQTKSAIHLASYVMWRLNWIHPFTDGNGRTTRALSYLVLCVRLGCLLPGTKTLPDQIVENKHPYYDALEAADEAWSNNEIDVSRLEELLGDMLAAQLLAIHESAIRS